jgi:hypothetical protein
LVAANYSMLVGVYRPKAADNWLVAVAADFAAVAKA